MTSGEAWTRRLVGDHGEAWVEAATTVAAYRDRYKVMSDLPVGGGAKSDAQRADRQRAFAALREATSASTPEHPAAMQEVQGRAISVP